MEWDGAQRTEMAVVELSAVQAAAYSAKLVGRENEVPMVSMDGEAHPNMTLAAIGLGVFVALVILLTLIAFITRRERSAHTKATQHRDRMVATVSQQVPIAAPPTTVLCTVLFANELEQADVDTRM